MRLTLTSILFACLFSSTSFSQEEELHWVWIGDELVLTVKQEAQKESTQSQTKKTEKKKEKATKETEVRQVKNEPEIIWEMVDGKLVKREVVTSKKKQSQEGLLIEVKPEPQQNIKRTRFKKGRVMNEPYIFEKYDNGESSSSSQSK